MSNWETASVLSASSVQTTTGAATAVDLGATDRLLRQTLSVTAVSGATPSMSVRLEASADGTSGWKTFATFANASAVTSEKISAVSPERYVRAGWTINGSGASFTFSVSGTQGTSYASFEQLDGLGISGVSLVSVIPTKKAEQLAATTELAASILAARYDMPLTAWGNDLSLAVCKIAAYELLSTRGMNPDGDDSNVRTRYEDAMKWLEDVAAGKINPVGLVDATPDESSDGGAEVYTYASRGWR